MSGPMGRCGSWRPLNTPLRRRHACSKSSTSRAEVPPHTSLTFLDHWRVVDTGPVEDAIRSEVDRLLASQPELNQFLYACQLLFLCAPDEEMAGIVRNTLLGSLNEATPGHRTASSTTAPARAPSNGARPIRARSTVRRGWAELVGPNAA